GYSPLQAGVRFLPSTIVIMFIGPLAGRLTDRIGPRPLIVTGLTIVAASLAWQSRLAVDSDYLFLLPAFVAMGVGVALTMSPMSTAAMNSVDPAGSGVAVLGAVIAALTLSGRPAPQEHPARVDSAAGTPAGDEAVGELVAAG